MAYQQRYINREFSFPHIKIAAASAHKSGDRERAREWEWERKGRQLKQMAKCFWQTAIYCSTSMQFVCLPSPLPSLSPHRYLHIFPLKRQLKWKCATTTIKSKAYTIRSWIIYRASCMNVNNKRRRRRSLRFMIVQIFLRFAKSAAKLTRTYLSATCNLPQDLGVSTYTRRTHDLPTCHTLPHTERHTLNYCARDSRGKCH